MTDDLVRSFCDATDLQQPICLSIGRPPADDQTACTLELPYGVLGRAKDCHVHLGSSKVSYRHAYLQAIAGGIYCVDLDSRHGIQWPTGQKSGGWFFPGETLGIGPYLVGLNSESGGRPSSTEALQDFNPFERYRQQLGPLAEVDLEFLDKNAPQPTWSVSRVITLVGRSTLCKVRFDSKSVSSVHCSLVMTPQGLWLVDLLGRGGTQVNGETVRCTLLQHDDELTIGRYRVGVRYIDATFPADGTATPEASPSSDDPILSSPYLEDSNQPQPLEWLGSIFRIEARGKSLIVLPVIDGCSFRYQQLQTESNSLRRKFEMEEYQHLLIDLTHLHYFGSELIGVLISLARRVTDSGGRAAMCGASDKMMEVLKNMSLHKLWPYFKTREEALRSFEQ